MASLTLNYSLIAISFTSCLLLLVDSLHFRVPRFGPDVTNMIYAGDAVAAAGAVELNRVDYFIRVGHVVYAERVAIWESSSGRLTDFSTHFTFRIDTQNRSSYGDGMSFFLAPVGYQIPPNSAGEFLGLFNTTTGLMPQTRVGIVTVEFDTVMGRSDPRYEHVGINDNSIASSVTAPWNASDHSGKLGDCWITYDASTKNLSVEWSYDSTRPKSTLWYEIDLRNSVPEWVSVGFSGATGSVAERHILESWEFTSSLELKESGQRGTSRIGLIVGLTVSLSVFILGGVVAYVTLRRRGKNTRTPDKLGLTSLTDDFERGAGPRRFSHEDLMLATNNFSAGRKLGEGGFGEVYKGYLIDLDIPIAVKRISKRSKQGRKEYSTEVKIISSLRHRNLVQLIGWCHDQGEFLLVYEFMPNRSLDAHLFGKKNSLAWPLRYKIALGLASAILYLHEEWEQCVIHRDIKSNNVMLDSGFNVKLGDFGLARLMDHEVHPRTTGLAGTLGYLAPEYVSTGRASKESDVYSYGVVALEIATGRKSVHPVDEENPHIGLVGWAWDLYGKGQLVSAVDEMLLTEFDAKQAEQLMTVGLWCAHPDHNLRPSIRQAIQVLNFEAALPNLSLEMPVPVYYSSSHVSSVSSSEPLTSNSSITIEELPIIDELIGLTVIVE